MQLYRIADSRHPIWSGQGAALVGGRWNSQGFPLIYASLSYACAMLEVLVHSNSGRVPKTHQCIVARVGAEVSTEILDESVLPKGWADNSCEVSRNWGDTWILEARSAVLVVPSVIAPFERNALINPSHPDFSKIIVNPPIPVFWDARLFANRE